MSFQTSAETSHDVSILSFSLCVFQMSFWCQMSLKFPRRHMVWAFRLQRGIGHSVQMSVFCVRVWLDVTEAPWNITADFIPSDFNILDVMIRRGSNVLSATILQTSTQYCLFCETSFFRLQLNIASSVPKSLFRFHSILSRSSVRRHDLWGPSGGLQGPRATKAPCKTRINVPIQTSFRFHIR